MRIGIYKIGKKVYFYENTEDHASWSFEVTQVARILASQNNQVFMLSDTDYNYTEKNIYRDTVEPLDKIFVFNGMLTDLEEYALINKLKYLSSNINYILTDLALMTKHASYYEHIYSQSHQLYEYGAIQQAAVFGYKPIGYQCKDIMYYFGGTERNRLNDIIEYIHRPDCKWTGKSAFFNKNEYIPFDEHVKLLKRALSTIVIGDERYNPIGFVTPRYYECIAYDVIAFVDKKFDIDELIMPMNDWCRVSSYKELYEKQQELIKNPSRYDEILALQRSRITREMVDGINIYKFLMNEIS